METLSLDIIIPTLNRGKVLIDTIDELQHQTRRANEIIIVDQTLIHDSSDESRLNYLQDIGTIQWIKVNEASITKAMNLGLVRSKSDIVLFLDDDIVPDQNLVEVHLKAQKKDGSRIVAGRVIQPWHNKCYSTDIYKYSTDPDHFNFNVKNKVNVRRFMAGNVSIYRTVAIDLGGFDENFIMAAYKFEAEFSERAMIEGLEILYEPHAIIEHLKTSTGGTRVYGNHLTALNYAHSHGEYYYLLGSSDVANRLLRVLLRLKNVLANRFTLHKPWWIPVIIYAEIKGMLYAYISYKNGKKLIKP